MLWNLPPSRSTLPTTLPAASSSLTTIHNNNSSRICRPRTSSHPRNPNLFSASSGIRVGKWKYGKWGRMIWLQETSSAGAYFGGTHWHDGSRTLEQLDLLRRSVSDAPRHHRQSSSEDIRSQPMPYTCNNNGNNGHGLGIITSSHIPLGSLPCLLTFCSLQTSISILASNSNSYTLLRYPPLLRSHIILVRWLSLKSQPFIRQSYVLIASPGVRYTGNWIPIWLLKMVITKVELGLV